MVSALIRLTLLFSSLCSFVAANTEEPKDEGWGVFQPLNDFHRENEILLFFIAGGVIFLMIAICVFCICKRKKAKEAEEREMRNKRARKRKAEKQAEEIPDEELEDMDIGAILDMAESGEIDYGRLMSIAKSRKGGQKEMMKALKNNPQLMARIAGMAMNNTDLGGLEMLI